MPEDKPVHIRRESYPDVLYPAEIAPLGGAPYQPPEPAIHLRDYWNVIIRRRWTIAAVLATTVLVTMIITVRLIPVYSAEATVQIDRENQNVLSFKDVYQIDTQADDTLQTQYKVLSSRALARRVVEQLKLDREPEFAENRAGLLDSIRRSISNLIPSPKPPVDPRGAGEPDRLRPIVDEYERRLTVTPIARTRLAKISFESRDPRLAALIINEHGKQYIEQNLQFKFDATAQASDFLSDQLTGLKSTLEKSEDKLQDYSRQNQILFTDDGKNTAMEKLRQVEEEFTKAQAERIDKEAAVRQIESGQSEALPELLNNLLMAQLSAQSADLRRQDATLAATFGPEYPSRVRLRNQIEENERAIDAERQRVANTVRSEYAAAVDREKLLAAQLDQQRSAVQNINQDIIQYNILKREVDSNKQIYDGLLTRLKEAGVSAGLRASNIRVVDQAEVPMKPSRPQKILNLTLSLFSGLIAGIGLAFLQEYLDNTVKSPDDVTRIAGIPTLAVVPKLSSVIGRHGYKYGYRDLYGHSYTTRTATQMAQSLQSEAVPTDANEVSNKRRNGGEVRVDLIVQSAPSSLMAEAYRSLRTSLLLSVADHPPRSVLVTSSMASEGKTATAMNLAVALTQSGARTLLIDGDMRKPRVHQALGLGTVSGLSNFLTGSARLQEVIHPSAVENLFVIPCGPVPPNPAELILSSRFSYMMDAVREYFDYVILDSPPLAHVSDARILANKCEAALIVIKAGSTSRHSVMKAIEDLGDSKARLAGAVLNDYDVRSGSSDYSRYSGRYGSYGYGQRSN